MSPERLRELLESYGSRESNWPAELRESMRAGLPGSHEPHKSPELQAAFREAHELDELLDSYVPATARLEQRILEALPRPVLDRLLAWLAPQSGIDVWRPALAAALPLVVGVTLGLNGVMLPETATGIDWAAQEQSLLVPPVEGIWDE